MSICPERKAGSLPVLYVFKIPPMAPDDQYPHVEKIVLVMDNPMHR
jgi:hypothetical protein